MAEVLQIFTSLLQRASIDEAYLDITEAVNKRLSEIDRQVNYNDLNHTYVVGCDIEDFIKNVYNVMDVNQEHNLKLLIGGMIVEEIRREVYNKTGTMQ